MITVLIWGLLDDNDVEKGNSDDALTFWYAFPVPRLHPLLMPIPKVFYAGSRDCPQSR